MPIKKIQKETTGQPTPDELHDFYTYKLSKNKQDVEICLDRLRITNRLRLLGYFRFDREDGSMCYVHIDNGKIKIVNERLIIDAFEDYVLRLPDRTISVRETLSDGEVVEFEHKITAMQIEEQLYKSITTWFSTLDRLRPTAPIEILQDEADSKFFFFHNTAVRVSSKDGIVNIPYDQLRGYIWDDSIHDRDFTYTVNKGDFETFFENVCGRDNERKTAAMSLLGYLMHDYYDTNLAAVMLTDVNLNTAGRAAGRTGKGLIGKGLGQMLNKDATSTKYVSIDGKKFVPDEGDGKCYSAADMSTQLIHIEDLKSNFNLEPLFGDITDGCTMRKLHENKTKKYVKFLLSMNSTMYNLDAESVRGRLYIFELANYYKTNYRPTDEFRWFWGKDWKEQDWNEFYSFMLRCQLVYFQNGVIEPKDVNYYTRSLKESLPEDFLAWFEQLISPYVESQRNVRFRKREDLFLTYQRKYPMPDDERSRRKFTTWCKRYLERMNIPYKELRATVDYLILYPTSND